MRGRAGPGQSGERSEPRGCGCGPDRRWLLGGAALFFEVGKEFGAGVGDESVDVFEAVGAAVVGVGDFPSGGTLIPVEEEGDFFTGRGFEAEEIFAVIVVHGDDVVEVFEVV